LAKKVKQQKISKNYMDSIFVHKPTLQWHLSENESKKQIVVLDVENTGFFNKIAQKFFHRPKVSHISLDEYGSSLWLFLDGTSTVFDIVNKMKEKFPSEEDKMLNRVITFLHTLQVNEFILQI
jgi:gentisate 1,2-dioxygenase